MYFQRWSPASAKTAQAYANTCSDGASGQGNVGENIYLDWSEKNPSSLDKYVCLEIENTMGQTGP